MKTRLRICKMTGTIILLPYIAVGEEIGNTRIDEQMLHVVILDYIISLWSFSNFTIVKTVQM